MAAAALRTGVRGIPIRCEAPRRPAQQKQLARCNPRQASSRRPHLSIHSRRVHRNVAPARAPARPRPTGIDGERSGRLVARSGLEGFLGLSAFLKPEFAAIFSAILAIGSVGLNYYGSLLTESKRVELQKEVSHVLCCCAATGRACLGAGMCACSIGTGARLPFHLFGPLTPLRPRSAPHTAGP